MEDRWEWGKSEWQWRNRRYKKTSPFPHLLRAQQALPNCKPISVGRPDAKRYVTPSPHPPPPGLQSDGASNWATKAGQEKKTRGPWWSYIAHLSKQLCILTAEVSAKFTALRFLYKFYSPAPQRPCFLFMHHDGLNWILKEDHQRNNFPKIYWNWSSGYWQKDFNFDTLTYR